MTASPWNTILTAQELDPRFAREQRAFYEGRTLNQLQVHATPTAERAGVARAPLGISDEAMTGAWRVIIARVPDHYVAYYYHENDDKRLRAALKLQAERWIASHEG
jgi:hypothetical protein